MSEFNETKNFGWYSVKVGDDNIAFQLTRTEKTDVSQKTLAENKPDKVISGYEYLLLLAVIPIVSIISFYKNKNIKKYS